MNERVHCDRRVLDGSARRLGNLPNCTVNEWFADADWRAGTSNFLQCRARRASPKSRTFSTSRKRVAAWGVAIGSRRPDRHLSIFARIYRYASLEYPENAHSEAQAGRR